MCIRYRSRSAAFVRDAGGMRALARRIAEIEANRAAWDPADPALETRLRLQDALTVQKQVLAAMLYDRENPAPSGVLETRDGACRLRPARALPPRELWFERVWRAERENDGEQ